MKKREGGPVSFTASVYKLGILRCVDLPERVARRLGAEPKQSVRVVIAGREFATGLVGRKGGGLRLFGWRFCGR